MQKIEFGLEHGHSLREIAKSIKKNVSTVQREIKRNAAFDYSSLNKCAYLTSCEQRGVCGRTDCRAVCGKRCKKICFKYCSLYKESSCEKLLHSPHVCNNCRVFKQNLCTYDKYFCRANEAHSSYRNTLKERNAGFDLTLDELHEIDRVITPGIMKGQSPYHIVQSNKSTLPISVSTVYRMIDAGVLGARNIDLKEKVKRRPRNSPRRKMHNEVIRKAKVNHMWEDWLDYKEKYDPLFVEMDCVEGKRDEAPAILTLHYPDFRMQIGAYLEQHNASNVVAALDMLETTLGTDLFCKTFPVIITDNGQEFTDIQEIEQSCLDPLRKRTKIFFCEPNRADEKGACENNHKCLRWIIPKGTSLVGYTQAEVTLAFNNINSYRRESQFGKSAYDVAMSVFPKEFFDLLGLYIVKNTDVELTPKLISKYRHNSR